MQRAFNCKIEEFPSVAKMMRDSFVRDLTAFTNYKPKYDQPYVDALDLKCTKLTDLVENKIKIAEMKKMTSDLYAMSDGIRDLLNKLQGYVEDAQGLTVGVKSFRFKEARAYIDKHDIDGLLAELLIIKQLTVDNKDALETEGYTSIQQTSFSDAITNIDQLHKQRNLKEDEKEAVIQANIVFLNELWQELSKIAADGKRLYKKSDPEKTGDYTFSTLLRRISNQSAENTKKYDSKFTGITKDFETLAILDGVKVWSNDNMDGATSDETGKYILPVNYSTVTTIYASYTGYNNYEMEIDEISQGAIVDMDIEMEKTEGPIL